VGDVVLLSLPSSICCQLCWLAVVCGLFYFGRVSFWRFLWRAGSYFLFCVGLRCVGCRAGTIYLSASLGRVAGLYRFFLLLGSVVAGAVRLIFVLAGGGWRGCTGFFFLVLFSVLCSLSC